MDITSILITTTPVFFLLFAAQSYLAVKSRSVLHSCYALVNLVCLLCVALLTFTHSLEEFITINLVLTFVGICLAQQSFVLSKIFMRLVKTAGVVGEITSETDKGANKLTHLVLHDDLTGLPNKHSLNKWSQQHPSNEQVLVLIKLNQFDQLNHSLGYQTTDLVLIQIAKRINKALLQSNQVAEIEANKKLIALGGIRFACIVDTVNAPHIVESLYQQIKQALPDPIPYESMMLSLSFNMGVSGKIINAKHIDECLQQAQTALDFDHLSVKSCAIFSHEMNIHNQTRQKLLVDLSQAIKQQQLTLFSQPIVDLTSKQLVIAESLIRWRHPEIGLIEPERFIELAERTGVIYSITQWVVKTSIAACAQWHQQGLVIKVSINIASKDLLQHEFVDFVSQQLELHQLKPEYLVLEIREQALMQEPVLSHSIIERLADMGIKVVIDDFGTGFSSLAHLRALPLYGIKIDRQFIKLMSKGTKHKTLVNTMVDMVRNLRRQVFAEGIEDTEQENTLKAMGCQYAQGFIFSRPLEIEGIASWAKQWQQQLDNNIS